MTELLTSAQMRAIEQAAIASGAVTGLELMERAGQGVVEAVLAEWPELAAGPHRAVVLCGPGNNGGDGFVVARLLKGRGWEVEVFLYGDPGKLPPDARANYERWVGMGEVAGLSNLPDLDHFNARLFEAEPDLYIDALFGTGLARPMPHIVQDIIQDNLSDNSRSWFSGKEYRVISVDVPSGLCADSGRTLTEGVAPLADLTVTFHRAKVGHYLAEGSAHCGKVVIADIGLPAGNPASMANPRDAG